jgi:hypothetical protein
MNVHRHNHRQAVRQATKAARRAFADYQAARAHGDRAATVAICAYADKLAASERMLGKAGR